MRNNSPGIALMGADVLKRNFPNFITAHATSLILLTTSKGATHDLARLIEACCHLRYLHISTNRALHIPRPLEQVSYIYLKTPKPFTPDELTALFRLVPNVRQIGWLPPTSDPLDEESGALGPLALRSLNVFRVFNTPVLLAPLLTRRWSVRTLMLYVEPATLQILRCCGVGPGDLPATHELEFIINDTCKDETAPLHALIAACHLRSLAVQASAERAGRLLTAALGTCGGLRKLALVFEGFEDAEDIQMVEDTLVGAMPRALRSLELFILPLYSSRFNALRSICRSRRISLNIKSV